MRDQYEDQAGWSDSSKPGLFKGPLWRRVLVGLAIAAGTGVVAFTAFILIALQGLPGLEDLKNYQPLVTSRVHAADGTLVAEFATEQRVFVPIDQIPDHVKNAFIATEDARFFEHSGIDYRGLARAMVSNVGNVLRGRRLEGASTITQQVAGNMLTGRAAACEGGIGGLFCAVYTKFREGLMAQRIEKALDKNRILELYLNQIYLGNRAYGVAAASLNYFDKPLSELTIGEAAYLALLPKGPGNYDLRDADKRARALDRRNHVISRMLERGYITTEQATAARVEELVSRDRLAGDQYIAASHFVEEVRRETMRRLPEMGEREIYEGGYSIRSTVDTRLQLAAARVLRAGLEEYDRRHEWRGPVVRGDAAGDVRAQLREAARPPTLSNWLRAMVTGAGGGTIRLTDENGATGRLLDTDAQWVAQHARGRNRDRALARGAIVYVTRGSGANARYTLRQTPQIQGALVAMDPHTGRVLALVGGYSFNDASGLNRATQAQRQPGSAFKPIVYAAALDPDPAGNPAFHALTPATMVDDGPLAIEAGDGTNWSPENYTRQYYGMTTLRRGLEMSRNAMTARVAYEMGAERVLDYGRRLGIYGDNTQAVFALALGTGETSLMRMTTAYGMLVNGGRGIEPIFIDRIQDRTGRTIYRVDRRECPECTAAWRRQAAPVLADTRAQVLNPVTAYQVVSMTQGVVQRGTGSVINELGIPLGGKTGTTNDFKDAWFIGYSPDLVVGIWVGFDIPRDMGEGETGGRIAAPMFRDFMRTALQGVPATPFRVPPTPEPCVSNGVSFVRIDPMTGLPPASGVEPNATILEAFRCGTEPSREAASSPFRFLGTEQIDPRTLSGLEGVFAPTEGDGQRPRPGQQSEEECVGLC